MRRWTLIALAAITLFGGLLRLDAVTVRYGWMDHPAWAVRIEQRLLPVSKALRPAAPWSRVDQPYVGGDPINYLRFAREMRHFYQAHVREPVFLALTRMMLWLMHDSDIGVSYASWLAGTLAIVAAYLLGAAAWSRAAGLIAAAALAIELEAVRWAADGWRDDTFMLAVALSAWAFVRLLQRPTVTWAVAAGRRRRRVFGVPDSDQRLVVRAASAALDCLSSLRGRGDALVALVTRLGACGRHRRGGHRRTRGAVPD
jgi:hypothetical protein